MKRRKPGPTKPVDKGKKKPYAPPHLTVHGTLETLTAGAGDATQDGGKKSCLFDQQCASAA